MGGVPRTVRMRLTLLYGALFTVSGAGLLGITFLLVRRNAVFKVLVPCFGREEDCPYRPLGPQDPMRALARQQDTLLHEFLVQSGIALGIMLVVSLVLGWFVAGRALRPLRTMTATVRHISARNVHERLAFAGPRDELKDLADTVDGLLGRLDAALDAQKRFVANAAHELRTPLTLERALLEETLTDRRPTLEAFRATFERILTISDQQARLLESLLTLATSERGLESRVPVDLAALTEQVLAARPEPSAEGPRLDPRIAPAATAGDPALVERLVANLVDNAVRYNVPGGSVEVATGSRDGTAVVSVSNTGPVVPAEQVARLLEPFQRLDRSARGDGHHGLGLSIAHAIVLAHGGTLSARPRPGGGLVVRAAFPAGRV
ncbi:sensor histidine kinase [Actinomadura opuntiae]|uniref:sensor histidine kinase n=1 Tax=Actinomadura sp. OS1-43 TaxID=604315 RepID=UPI00255AFFD5|nr:HAMP domain-containing sensor histidine kinase [Actinomadura sp. OS1-43]MDL4812647.1 HAMP domain-containing sensor histidine kinase [Actinomadura sp. OS1-43]